MLLMLSVMRESSFAHIFYLLCCVSGCKAVFFILLCLLCVVM